MSCDIKFYGTNKDPLIFVHNNFFNQNELDGIWQELNFLTYRHKLLGPEKTNSATKNGKLLKKNSAIFLEDVYHDKQISNILAIMNKTLEQKEIDFMVNHNTIFSYLNLYNNKSTLLSYYEDGDYYEPHPDVCTITILSYFFEEPKQFEGGNLTFTDFDLTLEIHNNMVVYFPSCYNHMVDKIEMKSDKKGVEFNKKGRYCIKIGRAHV